jgi:hypothetical protein
MAYYKRATEFWDNIFGIIAFFGKTKNGYDRVEMPGILTSDIFDK